MTEKYGELLTKTFRDDAIKSVIFIDDDFVPYESLVEQSEQINIKLEQIKNAITDKEFALETHGTLLSELDTPLKQSKLAKEMKEYFHTLSLTCDIENTTKVLSAEKIRKSDLIVLDYQLEGDDPKLSLELLCDLSKNSHMNIVVVYTSNNLDDTWVEIVTALRGSFNEDPDDYSQDEGWGDKWETFSEDISSHWDDPSYSELAEFMVFGTMKKFRGRLARLTRGPLPELDLLTCYLETKLARLNTYGTELNTEFSRIRGNLDNKECRWIQSGNVFITLVNKAEESEETIFKPQQIWGQIELALRDWKPSFYRVIASELQNRIENGDLSVGSSHKKGNNQEGALLWHLLNSEESQLTYNTSNLLEMMLLDIFDDFNSDRELLAFIIDVMKNIEEDIPEYVKYEKGSEAKHKAYLESIFKLSHQNSDESGTKYTNEYAFNLVHTLNQELSLRKNLPDYITTGLVLVDSENKDKWYLCVTPSCNTVPGQDTDDSISMLKPHRANTLIKLEKCEDYKSEIKIASQSKSIFLTYKGEPFAFRVVHPQTSLPSIEKVIVLNHDNIAMTIEDGKQVSFLTSIDNELVYKTQKLLPVVCLRPAYAARYQNFQSHYEGRIGVDFVALNL